MDDGELAATTSVGSVFQMCEAASAKARLSTVDSLTGGTTRRLALVECNFLTYKMCIVLKASCCLQYITRPTSQPINICMILHLQNNSKEASIPNPKHTHIRRCSNYSVTRMQLPDWCSASGRSHMRVLPPGTLCLTTSAPWLILSSSENC